MALDLPETYFDSWIEDPKCACVINHYSPIKPMDDQVSLGAHSDFEFLTVLRQDEVPGLQVLNKAGQFIEAPPVEGTFVINIADLLQRLSNDYFRSTIHRVVNKTGKVRYSLPFFMALKEDALVNVLPTCITPENPARYPPMTALEYITFRINRSKEAY